MIRVKIRYDGSQTGKVLRFDESIEFGVLLRKIVEKLEVWNEFSNVDSSDLTRVFQLRLGMDCVLEDTTEIDHGDELILVKIHGNDEGKMKRRKIIKIEETKKEPEDSTDYMKQSDQVRNAYPDDVYSKNVKRESEKFRHEEKLDVEIISISSDDNEEYSTSDDESSCRTDNDSNPEEPTENDALENVCQKHTKHQNKKYQRKPKITPQPPLEVIIDEKDVPSAPGKIGEKIERHTSKNGSSSSSINGKETEKVEFEVKERIIKLLNTGFHDQSNEHEAKNAMKLAQRLMRKHNLSQALLLRERDAKNNEEAEILKGGMVRLQIVSRKTRKPSLFVRWISQLIHPICSNFGVKAYHQCRRGVRCDVVFYGIYSNAQLAAYAFKVATERISQMSASFRPDTTSSRQISTKSSRLSYALGIVQGITKDVETNLKMEKARRKRKLERARLAQSQGAAYHESEDEDYGMDFDNDSNSSANLNHECHHNTKVYSSKNSFETLIQRGTQKMNDVSEGDLNRHIKKLEEEEEAALVLVDHNKKIAAEVLEACNIKLRRGRKRKAINFDRRSYDRGVIDSKEIDMNQRAIED